MKSVKELNGAADAAYKTVLETVNAVIDSDSLVETDRYILSDTALGSAPGEGVLAGMAAIDGSDVAVFAINGSVLKGAIGAKNAEKIAKCIYNGIKMSAPVIGFIDTAGARIEEGIEALEGYGKIFEAYSDAYKQVPVVTVVNGSNFGMLSYLCNMSDFCITLSATVMGTSSPMIMAGASKTDLKNAGTGKNLLSTGVVSLSVKDNAELGNAVRKVLDFALSPVLEADDDGNRVAKNLKKGSKAADVIKEIVDSGSFVALYDGFAPEVITGLARLNGIAVGIVANNEAMNGGKLTGMAAVKINTFLDRLDSLGLPVINLVNCSGAVSELSAQGVLLHEVSDLLYGYRKLGELPKIALITGKAIGVGYVALAAKSAFDYTAAWDCAEIGMLESVSAAELRYASELSAAKGKSKEKLLEKLAKAYGEENMSALKVAEKGHLDNVIEPKHSRQYLIAALQAFL